MDGGEESDDASFCVEDAWALDVLIVEMSE